MDIKQSFYTAIRNLCVNKIRFFQCMLSMVIGVAGVVFVLCAENSMLNFSKMEDETYSSSILFMHVMTNVDLSKQIMPADMEQMSIDNPDVIKAVSPVIDFELEGGVRYGDKIPEAVFLEGVGDQYLKMMPVLTLLEGRFLQPIDISRERRVCVIGNQIANELMDGDALGKELKIWGENYTVVGVLGAVQSEYQPDDTTCTIYIPYSNAKKMVGQETIPYYPFNCTMYYDKYYVEANGTENMYNAMLVVEEMMENRIGMEKGAAWQLPTTGLMFLSGSIKDAIIGITLQFMAGVLIILIIGGVGIMNVMLVSVKERTKEIGIRKAFGATNRDIARQFSLEAVIISLLGGLVGIVIGLLLFLIAGKYVISFPMGGGVYYPISLDYMDLPVLPLFLAIVLSILIGVIFGTYPATKAAKMEIVDAINES